MLPKNDLQIQYNHYQNSNSASAEVEKQILKFLCNCKGSHTGKTIWKKNTSRRTFPRFKTFIAKATVTVNSVVLACRKICSLMESN